MADTNYNPQDEEDINLFDEPDEGEDDFSSFDDVPDEDEDNLSSFDDVPDETDDNEESEQADYNSSDDTPNDPKQEPVNNYEEAKKEFEAEAENAAAWSLAEFAHKDGGYAMFLDTLVKAYGIDPNQNMQAIIMQLSAKGCSLPQKAAELLINNNAATADKSLRCLEAGCGGENINSSKYSVSTITKSALDITLKTIEAFFAYKNISADSASLATSVGFAEGGSLESYNALLKDMLALIIPVSKPEDDEELDFLVSEALDESLKYFKAFYKTLYSQRPKGVLVNIGGEVKCLFVNNSDTIAVRSTKFLDQTMKGLAACTTDNLLKLPQTDIVGKSIRIKENSTLFSGFETSSYNVLLHLQLIYGCYLDNGTWKRTTKFKDIEGYLGRKLKAYWLSAWQSSGEDFNTFTARLEAYNSAIKNCVVLQECSPTCVAYLLYDTSSNDAYKAIYNYIDEAIKSTDRQVKANRIYSSPSASWLQCLTRRFCSPGTETATAVSFRYTSSIDNYNKEIIFGYQAIDRRLEAGLTPTMQSILLGRTIAGEDFTYDMTKPKGSISVVAAGSRSGKGVMTLSLLGTALACNYPFIYVDGKPDMASILWSLEARSGKPILAVDAVVTGRGGLEGGQAILVDNSGEPRRIKNARDKCLAVTDYDIPDLDGSVNKKILSNGDKYKLCSMVLTSKMVQISCLLDAYYKKNDIVGITVLDEVNATTQLYSEFPNIFSTSTINALKAFIGKAKPPEPSKQEEAKKIWGNIFTLMSYLGFGMGSKAATYYKEVDPAPPVTKHLGGLAVANKPLNCKLILIGQEPKNELKPLVWTKFSGQSHRFVHPYEAFYTDALQQIRTVMLGNNCVPITNNEDTRFIVGAYNHNKDTDRYPGRGYFAIHEAGFEDTTPASTVIKSYLTLNDNDYFSAKNDKDKYCNAGVVACIPERQRDIIIGTPDKPNDKIAFAGLVKHIFRSTKGKDLSDADLADLCSAGYRYTEQMFKDIGLFNLFPEYTCVEDWIHDIRPASLLDFSEMLTCVETGRQLSGTNKVQSERIIIDDEGDVEGTDKTVVEDEDINYSNPPQGNINHEQPIQEGQPNAGNNSSDADTDEARRRAAEEEARRRAQAEAEASRRVAEEEARRRAANQNTPVPVEGGKETTETPYGRQNAGDSTQSATAYKLDDAYQAQIDMGTPSDNPFVVYKGKGKHLREAISNMLVKHLRRMAGGSDKGSLDAITSFVEEDGRIIVNNMPFVPTLDPSLLYCVPTIMKKDIAQGRWAAFLNLNVLTKMKNLRSVSIKDPDIADCVWEDLGIPTYNTDKLRKKLKKCREFIIGGIDILKEDEGNTSNKKEPSENVKKVMDKSKMSNFANALGAALGVEGCSSDNHPVLSALGKSKGMRAMKFGALIGTATWVGSLLFAAANPFLIIGGLFTAGAYIKNCKDEAKKQSK